MASDWQESSLGELIEIKHGYAFQGEFFRDEPPGDILLTPGNFAIGGGFKADKLKYYDGPVPEEFVLNEGDLLVTMTDLSKAADTLGFPIQVPSPGANGRFLHNQRLGKVLIKASAPIEKKFLYYLLCSREYRNEVVASATGTTVKHTSPTRIKHFKFWRPPQDEQRAIAHILGSLDDKIKLNRRMNDTLEAMARAIFNSWFIRSKPRSINAAELIHTGILEIGDGYRAKNSELGKSGLPFIRASNLRNGFDTDGADLLLEESVAKAGSKLARVGDVAFTSKGTIGRIARVDENTGEFVYSPQVCYWRSLARASIHPAILYCWMQTPDFKSQIEALAGQTDMAPYVSLQDQRKMNVPLFPESQLIVGQQIEPILTRRSLNAAESRDLATLRDTVLPKLVSGDLRIEDAGRIIGRHI
jgi:type I restriction enzyme S subunit